MNTIGSEGNVGLVIFMATLLAFVTLYTVGTGLDVISGVDSDYFTSETEAPGLLTWLGNIGKIGTLFTVSTTFQFLGFIIGILSLGLLMAILRLIRG